MATTYSGDPAASDRDELRFLLQDTDVSNALMTDEELDYLLGAWPTVYAAARAAAETLASQFAQSAETSKRIGDLALSTSYSEQAGTYWRLADQFGKMSERASSSLAWTHDDALPTSTFTSDQFRNS